MYKSLEHLLYDIKKTRQRKQSNTNKAASVDPKHDVSKNSVTKSNAMVRAYYRYSLVEKRVMETLVSQLHPLRSDNKFQEIELTALTYSNTFNVDRKHAYEHISKAAYGLTRRVISFAGDNPEDERIEWPLMAEARYQKKTGRIICTFNLKVVPHLVGMTNQFTKYPLAKAVDFSSSYTWRFYELLMSWAHPKSETRGLIAGWLTVGVEELRDMLGVPKSYSWSKFEVQILNLVQAELQEKGNIHMTISRKKTGRKITDLTIEFIEDDQQELPLKGGDKNRSKAA